MHSWFSAMPNRQAWRRQLVQCVGRFGVQPGSIKALRFLDTRARCRKAKDKGKGSNLIRDSTTAQEVVQGLVPLTYTGVVIQWAVTDAQQACEARKEEEKRNTEYFKKARWLTALEDSSRAHPKDLELHACVTPSMNK